jgi:hypothetical protein
VGISGTSVLCLGLRVSYVESSGTSVPYIGFSVSLCVLAVCLSYVWGASL